MLFNGVNAFLRGFMSLLPREFCSVKESLLLLNAPYAPARAYFSILVLVFFNNYFNNIVFIIT